MIFSGNDFILYGAKEVMNYLRRRHRISLTQERFTAWRKSLEILHIKLGRFKQSKFITTAFLVDVWVMQLRLTPPIIVRSHSCFYKWDQF